MTDGTGSNEVFDNYNSNVRPVSAAPTGVYASGLETQLSGGGQIDFVLEEGLIHEGNPNLADLELEEIPFSLTFNPASQRSVSLNWRPDPALYVSVLGGFVEIVIDEVEASGASGVGAIQGIEMDIAMHWAGWKSIVQKPKSRRMTASTKKRTNKKK